MRTAGHSRERSILAIDRNTKTRKYLIQVFSVDDDQKHLKNILK